MPTENWYKWILAATHVIYKLKGNANAFKLLQFLYESTINTINLVKQTETFCE